MRVLFIAGLIWTVFICRKVQGQSDCKRTNRQPNRKCVQSCDPSTGCSESGVDCLCDGDCGYSCVKQGLVCGRPPRLSNANAQYDGTGFGETVTYACNQGYTLSGAPQRTCRANARWDGVGPNCLKMCVVPEIPFSTFIKVPVNYNRTYTTGERITLACKPGFEAKPGGNPIRICISGGWTRFPFECEGKHACKRTVRAPRTKCTQECSPVSGCSFPNHDCLCDGSCGYSCVEIGMTCGTPPQVKNGNHWFTGANYNDTANYTCDDGYSLNTAPVKRCTAKKRWDGLSPRCLRDCPQPSIPRNAIISNPRDKYRSSDKVTFVCNLGYNQEGMATQMCFLGKWTVLPFKCTEGGCGDPGTPEHGRKLGVTYSVNSRVYFNCDLGYELDGSELRKCQLNGSWTGEQPICQVVDCGFPPRPLNGTFIGNETTFQSSLKFECDDGFDLEGAENRMCTSDKNWSGKEVTCTPVDCGALQTPPNGKQNTAATTYTSEAFFDCDEGYNLMGFRVLRCQADRKWDQAPPTCQAVDCGPLNPPMNGSSVGDKTTFPNAVQLRCDAGFDLLGSSTRSCQANVTWSGQTTVCKAVDCGRLSPPLNGSVSGDKTTFPNQVKIKCHKGFILRGPNRRNCQTDRTWSGETTVCEAINCGKPVQPNHGSVFGVSTRYPHQLNFTCDIGYYVEGSQFRKCQADGTWSGNETTCKLVDCGPLKTPVNGTKAGKMTTYLTTVEFRCDDGFQMIGSSSRTCQANKQWSGEETSCKAVDCYLPPVPEDGQRNGLKTTFPNSIIFNCDNGFDLLGSTTRTCQSNGSWSGVPTVCKARDCGPIPAPTNGSSKGVKTTYPNKISFSCDEGYNLQGSENRTCLAEGVWSGEDTSCVGRNCGPLLTPVNGSVLGHQTSYPNFMSFRCDDGFILNGSSARQCQVDGTWSGISATCDARNCGHFPVPRNGSSTGDKTTYPNKVHFSCDEGFILSGSEVRQCQADGMWSRSRPACSAVDCGLLFAPLNGSMSGNLTVFPNSLRFFCDHGFIEQGSFLRKCQANGTWSGTEASCKAVDCGQIRAPQNGTVQGEKTVFPNTLSFSCDIGFILRGSHTRKCRANGTWGGKETTCEARDCGLLPVPINGSLTGSKTTFPNEVSFSCDDGFILKGSPLRQCRAEGTWSGNTTTCDAKDCGPISIPMNGSTIGRETTYPNKITFVCDPGFIMVGFRVRKCQSNGVWSGNNTFCEAVDCGGIATPQNGSRHGGRTTYPNAVKFSCDEGFVLLGSTVRRCQTNGTWSGHHTVCKAKDCSPLAVPTNGSSLGQDTSFPNIISFSCDVGFIVIGSLARKCQSNGIWSGNDTVCKAKDCGPLTIPTNGSAVGQYTTYPNKVIFGCDDGFVMSGSSARKCQSSGTWSGNKTLCRAIDCGYLDMPINGSRVGEETTYPHEMRLSCAEGFILFGSTVRRCRANGTWSGIQTVCKAKDCGSLKVPTNGSSFGEDTTFPNVISFSCDVGFIMIGSQARKCQSSGIWSGNDTFCRAIDCGILRVPRNGSLSGTKTYFPNMVRFACDEGFNLLGSKVRQCEANGTWSGSKTSCKAVDCGPLRIPLNGSSSGDLTVFPNFVQFTCDSGFLLIGSSSRMCQANGTWCGTNTTCNPRDCGLVKAPQNGSVRGDKTTFPNALQFRCDEGFILKGSFVRSCQANGTWSGTKTNCKAKDCGPLLVPKNGSMFGHKTTFPNEITFNCDQGFLMRGSKKRECQEDGTWSGSTTSCEAVDCGPLSAPLNGSLSGNLTVFPNSVQFFCDPGFIISGSPSRQCKANGTWNGRKTVCSAIDCGLLKAPLNGTVHGERTTYPNTLQFACDEGFTLHGSIARKCRTNGTWSGSDSSCRANDCGPLPVPLNGSLVGKETTYPNTVKFSCDAGFILSGSEVRQCRANRTWSGYGAYCEAIDCGHLDAPVNGSVFGNMTVFPNAKHLSCDPGFILGGSSIRMCQANGTWSGSVTRCTAIDCGHLRIPQNGSRDGERTTYPNVLQFDCDEGFTLVGSSLRKCRTNGTWDGTKPVCQANDCGPMSSPKNGSLTGDLTTYPNKVTFACDEGFILRGSKVRQCQANKIWSGNNTHCDAVDCGPLSVPINGSLSGDVTVFPNSVHFSCDPGFILHGASVRTCKSNASWSGNETKCIAIDCGRLRVPQNGSVVGEWTTYPNVLRFGCDEGFTLVGSTVRKCQTNGTWDGTKPVCQANDCGPISSPRNGSSIGNLTTYPNKVTFACDEGFILRGSKLRQCQADTSWSGNNTSCHAIDCGSLSAPINGTLSGNETVFPNNVHFSCDPGFILHGPFVRTCQSNGVWSANETTCIAVDCGVLHAPQNGSTHGEMTIYPNMVRFDCDKGFTLHGSSNRKCQTNGTWSGHKTFCQANDCGSLSVPVNGTMIGNQTTFPNKVTFGCDEGFILKGSIVRQCKADKHWSGNTTTCEAKDCGALAVPTNGSSTGTQTIYPNHVTFSCDEGFILKGSVIRMCQSDGKWSGNDTFCEAKDCGYLSTPVNGSLLGNETTFPHKVIFACDEGFNLRGSSIRQCLSSGAWSGNRTHCEAEDCGPLQAPMNGSSFGDKTTYPNKVNFDCDSGFVLTGSQVRQCQANGAWSGNRTYCKAKDCGPLVIPTNGSTIGNRTTYPNKISFQCDEGFILYWFETRLCQANGLWSGNDTYCEAVDCGPLAVPLNGSSTGDLTVYPNNVQFMCDPGFNLLGSSIRSCQANGSWNGSETFCEAVDCGELRIPRNGSMLGKGTIYPTILLFSCDEGFILNGSSTRKCTTNGTWNGSESVCHAEDCGPLPVPTNGSREGQQTTFPNRMLFSCDEGFILRGSDTRDCQADGTWNGNQTSCEAIDCGPLAVPLNGSSSGNLTVFTNSVQFTCDAGFILSGSNLRSCLSNGTWSGTRVACGAVDCGQPQRPRNGSVIGETTVFPNTMRLSCDQGFNLRGSPEIQCQANGTWSNSSSFCQAKDCGRISVPTNGSHVGEETTFPNEVVLRCDDGFLLKGPMVRRCQADGIWSGNKTSCEAVDCGPIPVPWNGSLSGDLSVFPNSVQLSCDPGFILSGSSTRTCQANGTWSGTETTCSPIDCGQPEVLQNGSVSGESTVFPNALSLSCDVGFLLRGPRVIRCQANGTWTRNDTFCEAKDCGPLSVPTNGSFIGNDTTFPNEVRFSCDDGFLLVGSLVRRCQADGTWSATETSCKARDCGPLPKPKNGLKSGNLTTYPNSVRFECDRGFILNGSAIRTCNASGYWDGNEVNCKAVDCGRLEAPSHGSVYGGKTTYPNRMVFSCDRGYDVIGSAVRVCQPNGSWDGSETTCEPKDCGYLPAPRNGEATGRKTTYPNILEFKCRVGFRLQGSAVRSCQENGEWSGREAQCQAVDCGPLATPKDGFARGNSTTYPSHMTFSCSEGFFLQGTRSRVCQADGRWSGEDVLCLGMDCGLLPPPVNGWLFGSKTTHPHKVSFTCKKGYRLVGPTQRMCMRNGSWTDRQPHCIADWCSHPPEVPRYAYRTWRASKQRYEHGERIFYSCKSGFIMVGTPIQQCLNGQWSELRFNCSAPSCDAPYVPVHAYITFPRGFKGRHLLGEKVYYSCQSGYHLVGIPEIQCEQGRWTRLRFKCEAVSCGALPAPSNGSVVKTTGITYQKWYVFACNVANGYHMRGSKERQCLANGTWGGVQPTCYLQSCDSPGQPLHGKAVSESRDKLYFGNVIDYQCDYGYTARGHEKTRCQIDGSWSYPVTTCIPCSSPLGLKNRMIFNHQLSASSERDSRHGAKHGRLHGSSAWCSARSSFPKYLQIDFGRTMEVKAVATQGHPRDYKWVTKYVLKYSLGKHWLTYQESGQDKVFKGNRDRNTVMKHDLNERLVAKRVRILRHQNSQDFMGSTVCLRVEVYGCDFKSDCITAGSSVFARWNSVKRRTRFFHGYVVKVRSTSIEVSPSGNHGANVINIMELPRAERLYVIQDKKPKPSEISIGSDVIVTTKDDGGFSRGKVTKKFATWYGVQLGDGEEAWGRVGDIRVLKSFSYCDSY